MRYVAFACDYDGTLAHDGRVPDDVVRALTRLRDTGRRLILVTGREMDDLCSVFPHVQLFHQIVAENGGVLFSPGNRAERVLGEPPREDFVAALREQGVKPLSVGRTVVATWHPYESVVLKTIERFGLEHQVIFNKGAVMVLPPGVNKASGLSAALSEFELSPHNVVGIGDAENDQAFLRLCECAVAVANALPALKDRADLVTRGDHGAGVIELIEQIIADDLRSLESQVPRHAVSLGTDPEGRDVNVEPYSRNILIAGTSGAGKSTIATGILERLVEDGYQFSLVDPEGDYETFADAIVLGDTHRPPSEDEVLQLLKSPNESGIVNLLGVPMDDRPRVFDGLFARLQELRASVGRPHVIALDEAHHLLPAEWSPARIVLPEGLTGMLLLTVHPEHLAPAMLSRIDFIIVVGQAPQDTLSAFAAAVEEQAPSVSVANLDASQALVWDRRARNEPKVIRIGLPTNERRRHARKYAKGDLAPVKSFYFRGPAGALNLRAQNLMTFIQLAEGVDEATWLFHLHRGDYSQWFREMIGDAELAEEAGQIEHQKDLSPVKSRDAIRAAIERRYTLPE